MKMVYYMPVQEEKFISIKAKGEMAKERAEFECCENALLLKTFNGIRAMTIQAEAEAESLGVFQDLDLEERQRSATMVAQPKSPLL